MNINTTKEQLIIARNEAKQFRKRIGDLRAIIQSAGQNPDQRPNYTERNKKIFSRWKEVNSVSQVDREYSLSVTTISLICNRIESVLNRGTKDLSHNKHKSLLNFCRNKKQMRND